MSNTDFSQNKLAKLSAMGLKTLWVERKNKEVQTISTSRLPHELSWAELEEAVKTCTQCGLCKSRQQTVFGIGNPKASILLIGEAPGSEEDAKGEPFVGQAGRLLDNMLAALKLNRRDDVFIANVLKCRPPENRNPSQDEIARCSPYLHAQIFQIQPKIIVALGRFAAQTLLDSTLSISALRQRKHHYSLNQCNQKIPVIVTYHPAYLLRNLPDKAKGWEDLLFLKRLMQK